MRLLLVILHPAGDEGLGSKLMALHDLLWPNVSFYLIFFLIPWPTSSNGMDTECFLSPGLPLCWGLDASWMCSWPLKVAVVSGSGLVRLRKGMSYNLKISQCLAYFYATSNRGKCFVRLEHLSSFSMTSSGLVLPSTNTINVLKASWTCRQPYDMTKIHFTSSELEAICCSIHTETSWLTIVVHEHTVKTNSHKCNCSKPIDRASSNRLHASSQPFRVTHSLQTPISIIHIKVPMSIVPLVKIQLVHPTKSCFDREKVVRENPHRHTIDSHNFWPSLRHLQL